MATVGKPAIRDLSVITPASVRQLTNDIRERFRVLEAAYGLTSSAQQQSLLTSKQDTLTVNAQIRDILRRLRQLENAQAERFDVVLNAAVDVAIGDPVYVSSSGTVSPIDPDSATQCWGFIGIVKVAALGGQAATIALPGSTVTVSGAGFTAGSPLYAAAGGVTHNPVGNALPVGYAIDAQTIAVGYGFNVLNDDAFAPTLQDDMAVTRGLAGAGGGGILPVVTGEVPPVLVYLDDGSLVYAAVEG